MLELIWIVAAYLLGSVPFALVVAKFMGKTDPRTAGSGNIGATNMLRTSGKKAGAITLVCDLLKGFLPTILAASVFDSHWMVAAVGLAAYVGHLFPVYLKFKGGKGIATGAGVFLAVAPGVMGLSVLIFAVTLWLCRWVGLASVVGAIILPLASIVTVQPAAIILLAIAVCALSVWKHKSNIQNILDGTEDRLGE